MYRKQNMLLASPALACLACLSVFSEVNAESWIIGVGDFGSSHENDTPDNIDDLIWFDQDNRWIFIQYLNDDGISVRNAPGSIDRIKVNRPGSGYMSHDEFVINNTTTSGTGLEASLNVTGPIQQLIVEDAGMGYPIGLSDLTDTDPAASGGTGFAAQVLTVTVGLPGEVAAIMVSEAGSGYEVGVPVALVTGFGLNDCTAIIDPEPDGTLPVGTFASAFASRGSGFTSTPAAFNPAETATVPAKFQAVLHGGINPSPVMLQGLLTSNGSGYEQDPVFQIGDGTQGTGARIIAARGPGPVDSVTIDHPGANYAVAPDAAINDTSEIDGVDDDGIGARFVAIINQNGPRPVTVEGSSNPINVSLGWHPYAGDFDGDGDNDIFWYSYRNKSAALWIMEAGSVADKGYMLFGGISDTWRVAGVGDFNLDTIPEVFFHNRNTGSTAVWNINYVPGDPELWLGVGSGYGKRVPNTDWAPFAVGETTAAHDGPEVLWFNDYTGGSAIWLLNQTNPRSQYQGVYITTTSGEKAYASEGWIARDVGDFNGNGVAGDILWHNIDDGEAAIWMMNFQLLRDSQLIEYDGGPAITDWSPIAAGGFITDENVPFENVYLRQNDNPHASMGWQMTRETNSLGLGGGSDVQDSLTYAEDGLVLFPSNIFQIIEFAANGTVSSIPMPPNNFEDEDSSAESADSSSDSSGDSSTDGDGGFNIDDFDINDPSTWP